MSLDKFLEINDKYKEELLNASFEEVENYEKYKDKYPEMYKVFKQYESLPENEAMILSKYYQNEFSDRHPSYT